LSDSNSVTAKSDALALLETLGVSTDKLQFQAFPDELPRFYLSSWK